MLAFINDTGILVVLVAAMLLFGASRIPHLARNLGEASKEFKKAQDDTHLEQDSGLHVPAMGNEKITLTREQLEALLSSTPRLHSPGSPSTSPS